MRLRCTSELSVRHQKPCETTKHSLRHEKFINEGNVELLLDCLFPGFPFAFNKRVPGSPLRRFKADFRNDDRKLIVEFDGDSHFRSAAVLFRDQRKDADYGSLGYTIVRIPYFIQPSVLTIERWFQVKTSYRQRFPHGFIHPKACLPAEYCWLGIQKFESVLRRFPEIQKEIVDSLKKRVEEVGEVDVVLPEPLQYLLND
jgi:very-short-patch-repair endonuclease